MKDCPTCGEVYGEDARICGLDGSVLVARNHAEPSAQRVLGGRYLLKRELGVGGFGAVYEAEDQRLRKRVAVKLLSPRVAANDEALARFQREAIAASQIGHEAIVEITDFDRDADGTHFIVMEFLAGSDLADVIESVGQLEPARALAIGAQVAYALEAAHRKGILHRDLKPANLYIVDRETQSDFVKVIDFGISKVMVHTMGADALTCTGQIMGTPYYMAPEQAEGSSKIDGRADVYSLGIILYEMLTGTPPFQGSSYLVVITKHLSENPVPPTQERPQLAQLAPGIDALILKALAKSPHDRYATMGEFGDAMLALLETIDPNGQLAIHPRPRVTSARTREYQPDCGPDDLETASSTTKPATTLGSSAGQQINASMFDESFGGAPSRFPRFAAAAVVAVAVALGAVFALNGRDEAPEQPLSVAGAPGTAHGAAATPGSPSPDPAMPTSRRQITVTSPVADAVVERADGAIIGPVPATLDAPPDGTTMPLMIRADGYTDTPVTVTASSPSVVAVALEKTPEKPAERRPGKRRRPPESNGDEPQHDAPSQPAGRPDAALPKPAPTPIDEDIVTEW